MRKPEDTIYLRRRAVEERLKAKAAEDDSVGRLHLAFAAEYERRAGAMPPSLSIV